MKKLLLTLLGVMTLCGLSPHQLQAQDTREATLDDGTPVTDVARASALTTDLDGKLVRLQFPVNVLASGTMDGATKCKYMIYGRDPENNPVVMMSKVATSSSNVNDYIPGPAFKAAADNIWTNTVFIPAGGIVGKAVAEKGHIIIVLKDLSNNDEQKDFDNSKYCHTGAALKYSQVGSGINEAYAYRSFTHHKADNITTADYGRMVLIRNVKYTKTGKKFSNKDEEIIPVETAPSTGQTEKYINTLTGSATYKMYSSLSSNLTGQSICGIVEIDDSGEPYIMLKNIAAMAPTPTITLTKNSQYLKFEQNEDKTAGTAIINHTVANPQLTIKPTSSYGISSFYCNSQGLEICNYNITSDIISSVANFLSEPRTLTLESCNPKTTNKTIPYDRSEPYTLTLIDPILAATPYPSFADIIAAHPEENSVVSTATTYFQSYNLPWKNSNTGSSGYKSDNWPLANGMVAYLRGKYMLVREIARNEDGSLASKQDDNASFYVLKRDIWHNNSNPSDQKNIKSVTVDHSGSATGGMSLPKRAVAEGDGVAKITGVMTYENGNPVIDLNQSYMPTGNSHQLSTSPTDLYFTLKFEGNSTSIPPALFADQLEEWRISSVITKPKETTLDASYVGKVVEIKGASIAKDGDAYVIGLKQPVVMSWFEGDVDAATHQAVLASADADAMFTLSGYVMNDGQGGVEIKLLSLDNTGEIIEVCEHPGHDSYCGDLSLDAYEGKVITLTGARIYKDNDDTYYTPIGGKNIHFEWTTNPTGETADKAKIKESNMALNYSNNRFACALLHDVSAKVKKDGDNITLDVLSIKQIASLNPDEYGPNDLNVYLNGVLAKPNEYSTEGEHVAWIPDFAILKAVAPEWSDLSYVFFSKDAEDLEWKPLGNGEALRIEYPEDGDIIIYVTGCGHGHKTQSIRKLRLTKSSFIKPVSNIMDMADYEESNPDNPLTYFLMKGSVAVVSAAKDADGVTAIVADNEGRHFVIRRDNAEATVPAPGTVMKNFGIRILAENNNAVSDLNKKYASRIYHDFAECAIDPADDEQTPAIEPVITDTHSAANVERHVRLYNAKISGNAADGFRLVAGETSISLNNAMGCEIADDAEEDAQYVVSGIMLPVQGKKVSRPSGEPGIATLEDAEPLQLDDIEFVPYRIEKRRATAAPTYSLKGYESLEDGLAVTVADVELTMECDEPYSTVSYSLDGGENWTVYDGTTVKITESANVVIKASVLGFDDTTVSFDIRREYFSTEATVKTTPASGYTTVVIAPAADLAADSYKIFYTTDGTEPTTESALYTAPIESEKAASIRALVVENGKRPGKASDPVAVSVRAHDLEITPEKGEGFTTVTIAPKDPKHLHQNAEIHYTTDGSEPTAGSALYTAPFEVEAAQNGMTVKAICIEPEKTAGQVAAATIAVEGLRPSCDVAITYREAEGVYYITLTAEAGTIHYSLNGAEEKIYDGKPIEYTPATDGTCTVKAYAVEEGKKAGKTATESFQVTGISGIGADGNADGVKVEGNTIIVPEGAQTFDIAGRRVNPQGLSRGIYIVRLASGKAVKVVIK